MALYCLVWKSSACAYLPIIGVLRSRGEQMAEKDIALMAHLMRRAGFGAQYDGSKPVQRRRYEATVEELLHPEDHPNGLDLDLAERYFIRMESFHPRRSGILHVSHDQLQEPVGREDGSLLARRLVPLTARCRATSHCMGSWRCSAAVGWAASRSGSRFPRTRPWCTSWTIV